MAVTVATRIYVLELLLRINTWGFMVVNNHPTNHLSHITHFQSNRPFSNMKFSSALFTLVAATLAVASTIPNAKRTEKEGPIAYIITDPYYAEFPQQFCAVWDTACNFLSVVVSDGPFHAVLTTPTLLTSIQ